MNSPQKYLPKHLYTMVKWLPVHWPVTRVALEWQEYGKHVFFPQIMVTAVQALALNRCIS